MGLNAQQKVKEKVLEKVIAQDQFSDGFRSLRDIFNQSKNDGFVEDFVDTILLSDYTNLKKAQSKNGTKNIPFIDNSKKLTGYDPTDFMSNTLIDNKDDDKDVVHDGVVDDFLSRLKNSGVDRTAARLKNTSIEFDDVNKTLSVKSFTIGDSGAEVDDQDYDSPFSNDKYYISNIRKLFLNELKVPTKEDDLSTRGDKLYICDFFEGNNKEEDLFYFNKFLLDDNLSKEKLTEIFVDKIKVAIDSRIESIVDINSPIFSLINLELGNVPIELFSDVQILLQIQKHKKSYDFSTIENIKKITSDEQFARFMKILAKI